MKLEKKTRTSANCILISSIQPKTRIFTECALHYELLLIGTISTPKMLNYLTETHKNQFREIVDKNLLFITLQKIKVARINRSDSIVNL